MKNRNKILPLNKDFKRIAVIGKDAVEGRLGGYSGPGNNVITILEGIKSKVKNFAEVKYEKGCERVNSKFDIISAENLVSEFQGKNQKGLLAKYFDNPNFIGEPKFLRIDKEINFKWTLFSPAPEKLDYDWYSVEWEGKIVSSINGFVNIGIEGNDGYRMFINNKLVIDNWLQKSYSTTTTKYEFKKNQSYDIKIQFYTTVGNIKIKLIWDANNKTNTDEEINKAVELTKKSDVAILVAGIEEGEFNDRAFLKIPGKQEELIKKVAHTGTPTIVLLVGGSAITMQNWINDVDAIVETWYPGEEGGNAIADILFGDYNPAGRLPITFPIDEAQLPLYYNHKPTGRGDDYNNLTGQPLFPFGYGLSYTKFNYSNLKLDKKIYKPNEKINIEFDLTNIGNYDGDEVIQLYIKDLFASVARPILELKGFKRVNIKSGETKKIKFQITPEHLEMLDENLNRIIEAGKFRIMIGSSSKDIRLRTEIEVR